MDDELRIYIFTSNGRHYAALAYDEEQATELCGIESASRYQHWDVLIVDPRDGPVAIVPPPTS